MDCIATPFYILYIYFNLVPELFRHYSEWQAINTHLKQKGSRNQAMSFKHKSPHPRTTVDILITNGFLET